MYSNDSSIQNESKMTGHCVGTVQMREESESGIDDSRRWRERGQRWRVMEDCSTDEQL